MITDRSLSSLEKKRPIVGPVRLRSFVLSCSIPLLCALGLGTAACALAPAEGEDELYAESSEELVLGGVTLKTVLAGRFVGAQNNGGGNVIASATAAQAWETFSLDDTNGGTLSSGDPVTIRTGGGQYFKAQNGGGSTLSATATTPLGWETFKIVKVAGTGAIKNGDVVGFQTQNGKWITAANGGGSTVAASGAALSTWEQFTIGGLSSSGGGKKLVNATFQNQALGTYTQADVSADFGSTPSWNNGLSQGRASIVQEGSNKFLRVTYPAGKFGPGEGGVQFNVDLKGDYEELFFSYRVRFAAGFDFVQGGKLPGLVGGSSPSGCTTDLVGGFSARNMWRAGGQVEQYMYYPERTTRCGDDWKYGTAKFIPGTWHTMEHRIAMGTNGQANGIMQGFMDGKLLLNRTNVKWRVSGANYAIDTLYFSTFFGGSDVSWAPRSSQRIDFDDFVVSDKPITH